MKISELWQWVKQHLVVSIFITGLVIFLVVSFIGGYFFNWLWTGFSSYTSIPHATNITFQREKTLWDWLQLLIIPLVIAGGGYLFTLAMRRNEQQNTMDNQRQAALQGYIDKISELLLHEHLGESSTPEMQAIARARTVTVLYILDPVRRGSLIRFLSQANILMICVEDALVGIDLSGADLTRVNLNKINLEKANLQGANLREASLQGTNLTGANLQGAMLWEAGLQGARLDRANLQGDRLVLADLQGAVLWGAKLENANLMLANLSKANLRGANLTGALLERANLKGVTDITVEQLESQAKSLKGATMPDGTKHP